MSATNETPNYQLPQYIGTDVPSYLGDFNSAMLKIDTAIKGVDNKATSAESSVATANSNASEAVETAGTAITNAAAAQATATQAKSTAETAKATATQAQSDATKALTDINKLNLTYYQKYTTATAGKNVSSILDCNINLVCDSTKKVFKLFGKVSVAASAKGYASVSFQTVLRPSETITIQGCGVAYDYDTGGVGSDTQIVIETNGKATIRGNCSKNTNGNGLLMFNMLYFLEKFDQTLIPDMT